MKTCKKLGAVLALGLGFSAAADSAILYDNLSGNIISALVLPSATDWIANEFSTNTYCPLGCTLGNITLHMTVDSGITTGYSLSIYTDNNTSPGNLVGTLLNPASFTSAPNFNVFTPNQAITLSNNTRYWVKLTAGAGALGGEWSYTNFNEGNNIDADGNSWTDLPPMMKVEATPNSVPVPATAWLMVSGFMGMFSVLRKKKVN